MYIGITKKLSTTYLIIIIYTIISGVFCFYVLKNNQHAYKEMQYITLPSLDNLKELKIVNQDIKKLAVSWVYIANNKDKDRFMYIINTVYPKLLLSLNKNAIKWHNKAEIKLYNQIDSNNTQILDTIKAITQILKTEEDYTNDSLTDLAARYSDFTNNTINTNDRLLINLIETKKKNLKQQQSDISDLLNYLYILIFVSIALVVLVSYIAMKLTKKHIVMPLLQLSDIISDLSAGDVLPISIINRQDEIGIMHNAISKMINGIIQKINFAEQIGHGNYDTEFELLSEKDKLGTALLAMRYELRKTHQALTEQDKRLLNAQKMARLGNYYMDVKTGTFQSSTTIDEIFGIDNTYPKTYQNWAKLISPEFLEYVKDKGELAIKNNTLFTEQYIINRHNDGEPRWVSVISDREYDNDGNPIFLFGTVQDITESKTLEIELNSSYKIATEQNKRLLNFSYIVSHNLRMHTVNIHSLLSMIDEAETDEERAELMDLLKKASANLDETMYHLNDVVAMQNALSIETTPQVLNTHIKNAIEVLKYQIETKNAIINNNVTDNIVIMYNSAYLSSVVLNFISNAIKYSSPARQPIITISCYKENTLAENGKWIFEIADNGIGIDMDRNGHKLFGMYKTFNGNKDAKGIGLFMTKYQIEAMGGNIEVESKLNVGTTFKIYMK